MEYRIVVKKITHALWPDLEKAAERLAQDVRKLAAAGWEPSGGVAYGNAGATGYLLQAMVKRR